MLSLPNIHQQDGNEDCGLYAIVIATLLAFEGDEKALLDHKFDQSKLRPHLCHCLENILYVIIPTNYTDV